MKAPASQWHGQIGRFSEPLVDIRHDAKFKIDIGDDFFSASDRVLLVT